MTARDELERRAALATLEGEALGTQPVLALLRMALDQFVETRTLRWRASEITEDDGVVRWPLVAEYSLCADARLMRTVCVYDEATQKAYSAVQGALHLFRLLRDNPDEALRVLRAIEEQSK